MTELTLKAEELYSKGIREVNFILEDDTKVKKRIGRTAEGFMIVMRTRTRGQDLREYRHFKNVEEIKHNPESEKWLKSINKAISLLEESGLYPEFLINLKLAKEIGYNKLQEALKINDLRDLDKDYYKNQALISQKIKELDPRLTYEMEKDKEIRKTTTCVNTEILYYMSRPLQIKKMYFGKYNNERVLKDISEAIKNKKKYTSGRFTLNYDVSFEYDGFNKAWYSEEYRNCGNGHYYLALSDKYAMFYEDD